MEIPPDLKSLYKHWESHTEAPDRYNEYITDSKLLPITQFITERMKIWERKTSGGRPPFTDNMILRQYRFCNIYRELDRQTIQIHKVLSTIEQFDLWLLNLLFLRFLCKPETFDKVGRLGFDVVKNKAVYNRLLNLPYPKYGTAYVFPISVIQRSEYNTREKFFCFYLPKIIPKLLNLIENFHNESVHDALAKILPLFGFNFKFHWTEVLIDIAYQYPEKIDLFKNFPVGPGALPTIKSLFPKVDKSEALILLSKFNPKKFPYLTYEGKPVPLSVENWEGICCEYRKYKNLIEGNGRRRIYTVDNRS